MKTTRTRDDVIARTQSKAGSTQRGLLSLTIIGCALIAWVIWLGHKEAGYDEQERVINAERVEWLQAVSYWTHHPSESMPELLQCLGQEDVIGRRSAALALYQIGGKARDQLPEFVSAIDDEDAVVRRYALLSLTRVGVDLGPWTEGIVAHLVDNDPGVREAAARATAHIGILASPAVSRVLVASAQPPNAVLMTVLSHLGTDDEEALTRIHQTLQDEFADPKLRLVAFFTLRSLEQLGSDDVESGLDSGDRELEGASLRAIAELRLTAPSLLKVFEEFLARVERDDVPVRMADALRYGPEGVTNDLIAAARSLGIDSNRILAILEKWIQDHRQGGLSSPRIQLRREIDRDEALRKLPLVIERLRQPYDARTMLGATLGWHEAIRMIKEIGPGAGTAVPTLMQVISNGYVESTFWRDLEAIDALGAIGPAAREAVPIMIEWLRLAPATKGFSQDAFYAPHGRALAVDALRRIGVWNAEIEECLDRLRSDLDPGVRRAVILATAELAPEPVEHLIAALDDAHCLVRRAAAAELGRLGHAAIQAIPALRMVAENHENAIPPRVTVLGDEQILVLSGLQWSGLESRVRERTVRECALEAIDRIERSVVSSPD